MAIKVGVVTTGKAIKMRNIMQMMSKIWTLTDNWKCKDITKYRNKYKALLFCITLCGENKIV